MTVEELLNEQGKSFLPSGKDFVVRCLNPDHEDKNPSFRIDRVSGLGHCFSCGFATDIFAYYGKIPSLLNNNIEMVRKKIKKIFYDRHGVQIPSGANFMEESYRGLPVSLVKDRKFFTVSKDSFSDMNLQDYIVVPMYDSEDKIAAFTARHKLKEGEPKYKIYPKNAEVPLYPFDYKIINSSLLVIESMFDALHLMAHGIENVVASSGTESFLIKLKQNEASFRIQGLAKIYLMMDGDKAGRSANEKLHKFITEKAGFMCEIIELQEDSDPSDLTAEDIQQLKKHITER